MPKPQIDLNSMTYTASDGSVHDISARLPVPRQPRKPYTITGTIIMIDLEAGLAAVRNGDRVSILQANRPTIASLRHGQHVTVAYTPGISTAGANGTIVHIMPNPTDAPSHQSQVTGSTSWTRVDREGPCDRCQMNKTLRWHSPSGIQHLTICSECMENGPINHAQNIAITPVHLPSAHDTACHGEECQL